MSNFLQQHCPNCKKQDGLHVTFTGSARLTRDGSEDVGDHEYSDTSDVYCENCDWRGMMCDLIDDTYFSSSCGRIEIMISIEDAHSGSHSGDCESDVKALRDLPYISDQLAALKPDLVRNELAEYGAWGADELADEDFNLTRLLWLACGYIVEAEGADA